MKDTYKIYKTTFGKSAEIQEKLAELNQMAMEIGQVIILSSMCKLLDNETPIPEIRKVIDLFVSDLSLDAIEFYCELKAGGNNL